MECIAADLGPGDKTEFGTINEVIATWSEVDTFFEYIEFGIAWSRQTLVMESGENVRVYA